MVVIILPCSPEPATVERERKNPMAIDKNSNQLEAAAATGDQVDTEAIAKAPQAAEEAADAEYWAACDADANP